MRRLVFVAFVLVACGGRSSISAEDCRSLAAAYAELTADTDPSDAAREEADRVRDEWLAGGCDQLDP